MLWYLNTGGQCCKGGSSSKGILVRVVHRGCRAVCVGRRKNSSVQGLDLEGGCCRMLSRTIRNSFIYLGKQAKDTDVLLQEEG